MTSRLARYSGLGSLLVLVLFFLATPLGPWILGALCTRLAPSYGWHLEIHGTSGRFLGQARFHQVRAASREWGLEIALERLDFSTWSYAVKLVRPQFRLQLAAEPDTEAASAPVAPLPVEYFPALHISQGRLQLIQPDSLEVLLEDLDLRYEAASDTSGRLFVTVPRYAVSRRGKAWVTGDLRGRLNLEPHLLSLTELHTAVRADTLRAELEAAGRLGLVEALPTDLRLRSRFHTEAESLQGQVDLGARGRVLPLDLEVEVQGTATQADWGALSLAVQLALKPEQVAVDSLKLELLGGQINGEATYLVGADSVEIQVEFAGVDLGRLPASRVAGRAAGNCRAGLNLHARRYTAEVGLDLQQLDVLPGGPYDFHLSAALRPDQSIRAELRSQLGHLEAAGFFDPQGPYELALEGVVEPALLLGREAEAVRVEGWTRPDTLQLHFETARLPFAREEFGPVLLDLTLREQRFLETALALEEDQARLYLSLDLVEEKVDSLLSAITPLALGRLFPDLEGTLEGQVRAGGGLSPSEVEVSGRFELLGAAYRDWHTGPLSAHLEYGYQRSTCFLEGQGFKARVSLDTLNHFSGQAHLDHAVFYHLVGEDAAADSAARVVLSGSLQWAGLLDRLEEVEAHVELDELAWRQGDWEVRAAPPLRLHYSQLQASLERLQLHTPLGLMSITGRTHADSLDMLVEVASMDLQSLAADLEGRGRLQLQVGGTLDEPRLQGRAELYQIVLANQPVGDLQVRLQLSDSLALKAALEQDQDVEAELELGLEMPAAALLAGGPATASGAIELKVAARQLDLEALLTYFLADSVRGVLELEGALSAPLALLADSLHWHDLEGQVKFQQFRLQKQGLHLELPAAGKIDLEGDHLKLSDLGFAVEVYDPEEEVFRPGGELRLEGRVETARPFLLELELEELDLLVLEHLGAGNLPEGVFEMQARLSGTRAAPILDVDLAAALEDLGEVEARFHGSGQEGTLELDWSTLIGDQLQVRGRLPWDLKKRRIAWEQGTMQAHSEGLGLLILLDQFPQLDNIDGTLGLEVEVRGFDQDLQLQGRVNVTDLELALIDVKPGYQFAAGRLEFNGRRGEFRDFVGRPQEGDGRIEVSGFVEMQALDQLAYKVRLEAEGLPYNYDDTFDVPRIDMGLALSGDLSSSLLAGRVRLDQARVDLPLIDLNAPPVPPPPPAVQDEFLEDMELDVDIDFRDMHVENELTDLDLEGSARVYGNFYKPRFQGEVKIVEGKIFVLNREFDFQKGRINLDRLVPTYSILDLAYDPLLLNPDLDLEAVTRIKPIDEDQEYEIIFKLQGPVQEVAPRFVSEPSVEDSELLMLVAFGSRSSPSALLSAENRGALYSTAGQLLLSRQVKKIGLDEFQILPSGTVLGTVGEPSVRMGKYFKIPLPVWVRYEASTKDPSLGEFRVEHKLRSYLTITGQAQSEYERYGLGLGLKKEF